MKKKIAILCPHTFESNLYWINDVDWSKVIDCFGQSQIYWIINSHITFFAGNPLPKVTWWLEGLMIDSSDFVTRNGVIINQLVYKSLQRDDLFKMFDCQASNTNRTHPVSRKVKIILNCKWIYFKNKSSWVHYPKEGIYMKQKSRNRKLLFMSGLQDCLKCEQFIYHIFFYKNMTSYFI